MLNIEKVQARLSATSQLQRYQIRESFCEHFPRYRPILEGYTASEHAAIQLAAWCALQTTLPFDAIDTWTGNQLLFRAETYLLRTIPEHFLCLYALYWRKGSEAEHTGQAAERIGYNHIRSLLQHESSPTSYLITSIDAQIHYYHRGAREEIKTEQIQFYQTVLRILLEARMNIQMQDMLVHVPLLTPSMLYSEWFTFECNKSRVLHLVSLLMGRMTGNESGG